MRPRRMQAVAEALLILIISASPPAYSKIIYVDDDATGANNGTSWPDAFGYLQDALADARASEKPVEIRVAEGTYRPDDGIGVVNDDRWAAFELVSGVAIKGGYGIHYSPRTGASATRDIEAYVTFLSGDLQRNELSGTPDPKADNAYNVIRIRDVDETAVLDGVTVILGSNGGNIGGGIDCLSGRPTITHCAFRGNEAGLGAGIYIGAASSPTIRDCAFVGNTAYFIGGAVYSQATLHLSNCTFRNNTATIEAGAVCEDGHGSQFIDCAFSGNSANRGGAVSCRSSGRRTFINCSFSDNSAIRGGALCNVDAEVTIRDSVFSGNSADFEGGAAYSARGEVEFTDCRFISNEAGDGGAVYNFDTDPVFVKCSFSDNIVRHGNGAGIYNSHANAELNHCHFERNRSNILAGGAAYEFFSDSVFTSCMFDRNSAKDGGAVFCRHAGPVLSECTFSRNSGGALCFTDESAPTLTHCLLVANSGQRVAAVFGEDSDVIVGNCTFASNAASWQTGHAIRVSESSMELTNCILWSNTPGEITLVVSESAVTYCNVQGGWSGDTNMSVDPCFADPGYWDPNGTPDDVVDDFWVDGDYHLKSQAGRWDPDSQGWIKDDVTSPCIDAGDPDSPWQAELWPHGARVNMGAFGGTLEASMSLSGVGEPADCNNDGDIDAADLFLLCKNWLTQILPTAADINRDSRVDFLDYAHLAADCHP